MLVGCRSLLLRCPCVVPVELVVLIVVFVELVGLIGLLFVVLPAVVAPFPPIATVFGEMFSLRRRPRS